MFFTLVCTSINFKLFHVFFFPPHPYSQFNLYYSLFFVYHCVYSRNYLHTLIYTYTHICAIHSYIANFRILIKHNEKTSSLLSLLYFHLVALVALFLLFIFLFKMLLLLAASINHLLRAQVLLFSMQLKATNYNKQQLYTN